VILTLILSWHLDLAMCTIEYTNSLLIGREAAIERLALICVRPAHLISPGLIHCCCDVVCYSIRCRTADIIEEDAEYIGVIAVTVPYPQQELIEGVDTTLTTLQGRLGVDRIWAADVGFQFVIEEEELGHRESSETLESFVVSAQEKEGRRGRGDRVELLHESVDLML
jgi:hypothetical protein